MGASTNPASTWMVSSSLPLRAPVDGAPRPGEARPTLPGCTASRSGSGRGVPLVGPDVRCATGCSSWACMNGRSVCRTDGRGQRERQSQSGRGCPFAEAADPASIARVRSPGRPRSILRVAVSPASLEPVPRRARRLAGTILWQSAWPTGSDAPREVDYQSQMMPPSSSGLGTEPDTICFLVRGRVHALKISPATDTQMSFGAPLKNALQVATCL